MRRIVPIALLATLSFVLIAFPAPAAAASAAKGTEAMSFLTIGNSARSYGLAETLAADDASIDAVNYNPAGGMSLNKFSMQYTHIAWLETFTYDYAALLIPVSPGPVSKGNLLLSLKAFSVPNFDYIDITGTKKGTLNASDFGLAFGYNIALSKTFGFGLAARYLNSKLYKYPADSFAFDAGLIGKIRVKGGAPVKLGLAVRNLGLPVQYGSGSVKENLPAELDAAIMNKVYYNLKKRFYMELSASYAYRFNGSPSVGIGMELNIDDFFVIDTGYKFLNDSLGFNIGGGLRIPMGGWYTAVDFSYLPSATINNMWALTVTLGQSSGPAKPRPMPTTAVKPVPREDEEETAPVAPVKKKAAPSVQPSETEETAAPPVQAPAQTEAPAQAETPLPSGPFEILVLDLESVKATASEINDVMKAATKAFGFSVNLPDRAGTARLAESKKVASSCSSPECLAKAGRTLDAKYVVGGSLTKAMGEYTVKLYCVESATGKVLASREEVCETTGPVKDVVNDLAAEVKKKAK